MKKQLQKIFSASLIIALVFAADIYAQIDPALAIQLQNTLNTQLTSAGNHGVSAHLIFQNGQTWTGTAGVDGKGMPMTDSTVFIGASTSKMSIAIVLLSMAEDNILSLDDSWHKYAPSLNVAFDTSITIRQLLNHTSGIADYLEVSANNHYVTSNFSTFYTPQYILENIVSGVPDFPAGTNFNYSNSNYALAAYVAEAATPNPLKTELRTRVWNPAGMTHTYFGAYEPIPDPIAGVWWNFGSGITNYSSQSDTSMLSYGYGTDNTVTCPTDLARLVHALLNNQLLNAQSMNEMLTFIPQSSTNWTGLYGLGIHHLFQQTVDTLLGHDGKFCNLSDVFHSQKCGFTMATMTNTETVFEAIYNAMYNVIRNYEQCNAVPVANFYTGVHTACTGATIIFRDSSTNMRPTSWHWDFPGGTLTGGTTVTDSMPKVTYATPGTYAVSYTASTVAGSSSITKNAYITINSNIPDYNTAFTEGFETASVPGTDWSVSSTKGSNWIITSATAASGAKSIMIDNMSNLPNDTSVLIGPTFNLSAIGSPVLVFSMSYQQKTTTNNDRLQIYASTDCGGTWVSKWARTGASLQPSTVAGQSTSPFIPTSSQFTTYTVNLNSITSSTNAIFKWVFYSGTSVGNNIYLDNINIYDPTTGIKNLKSGADVAVYPNPTTGQFTVEANVTEKLMIDLYDVNGRHIFNKSVNDKSPIDVIMLNEGIYTLTIKTVDRILNKKLVILR